MADELDFPAGEPEIPALVAPRAPVILPWMLAGFAVLTLAVVAVYARKLIDDQGQRALAAQKLAEEYGARTGRLEQDRKDALRQAVVVSEKADELSAARDALSEQLKDKEGALAHLQERHETLVKGLQTAAHTAKGHALLRRVEQLLARDTSAGAPTARSPAPGRRRHRGVGTEAAAARTSAAPAPPSR